MELTKIKKVDGRKGFLPSGTDTAEFCFSGLRCFLSSAVILSSSMIPLALHCPEKVVGDIIRNQVFP